MVRLGGLKSRKLLKIGMGSLEKFFRWVEIGLDIVGIWVLGERWIFVCTSLFSFRILIQ
jgi:hypothetical protein